jgi:hypothetical protein
LNYSHILVIIAIHGLYRVMTFSRETDASLHLRTRPIREKVE